MVPIQFVSSRKEITGKEHTEPITTDEPCHGDSPSSCKSRALLYVVSTNCDYGPFPLFAMAPEKPRLMLQSSMLNFSHGLLLVLLSITAANLPPAPLRAWILVFCVSNAVVQSLKGGAVHNSLSPGQVTAEPHLAQVLPLLQHSDCFLTRVPPQVLKFAFHGPSAGLNSAAAKLAEYNTEDQLQSLLRDRRRFPGFQQVTDPAYRREISKLCTQVVPVVRNNTDHPWLKPNALGSHSSKGKWCFCWG